MHPIYNNIRMAIKVPNTNKSWKTTKFLLVWKFQAMARSIMATKNAQKSTIFCSRKRVKRCTWSIIKGTTSMQAPITNKILNLALVLCCSSSSSLYSPVLFLPRLQTLTFRNKNAGSRSQNPGDESRSQIEEDDPLDGRVFFFFLFSFPLNFMIKKFGKIFQQKT